MARQQSPSQLYTRRNRVGLLFILPFLIGFIWFFLPSLFETAYYAFNDVSLGVGTGLQFEFLGLDNFKRAFTIDAHFLMLLGNVVKGMIRDLFVITIFSFFIANVLNQKFIIRPFARVVFFLPVILATGLIESAQVGDILSEMYSGNTGNEIATGMSGQIQLMQLFDLEQLLLSSNISPGLAGVITGAVDSIYEVVNASGVQILIFLAGLQSISPSIFEASKVEGATKWEEFWKITFPMMMPMIFVAAIYTLIDSFVRPAYGVLEYIRSWGFTQGRLGYASSLSIIYAAVVLATMGVTALVLGRMSKNAE